MVMEVNKFLGALFGCLLVVVLVHLTGQYIFTVEKPVIAGYDLPTASGETAAAEESKPEEVSLATLLTSADPEKGKTIAKQCAACHTFDKGGKNGVGPNLWGIVNRQPGSHEGFAYSDAVKNKSGEWTYEDINHMITSPGKFLKGTKMAFAGLKKPQDRADVIAYLRTLADTPEPLPAAEGAPATEEKAPTGE